ncbi:MAG: hypothetical protein ABI698_10700 [bacterium]
MIVVIGLSKVEKYANSTTAPSTANSMMKTSAVRRRGRGSEFSSARMGLLSLRKGWANGPLR